MQHRIGHGLIVVGVDDSPESLNAARHALHEARSRRWDIRLVHAYGTLLPGTRQSPPNLDRMKRAAQAFVDGFAAQLRVPDGVRMDSRIYNRTPVDALTDAGRDANLVIVGHHGTTWGERLIPGSISSRLSGRAEVPVVTVPASWHQPTVDAGPVVVGLDAESPARGALMFAFGQANVSGSALTVLHAVPLGGAAAGADRSQAEISEALAPWRSRFPDVSVVIKFVHGDADTTLTEATHDAVMLVVGKPHEIAGFGQWLGSVGRAVLKHAACPVAVVPQLPSDSRRALSRSGHAAYLPLP